jgi:hypothetical protein
MTRKELRLQIKEQQKQLAIDIKRGKVLRSPKNWHLMDDVERKKYLFKTSGSYGINEGFMNWKVDQLSVDYRHTHIAYCTFFNNTPYEKIENPRKDHKPNTSSLHSLRKFWESQIEVENEKAVCDCA